MTALILTFLMTLVFIPTFSYADEAEGITVYLTVSNQGVIAQAGDGSAMAGKEVTVTDIDGDGHYTFDEALVAAHQTYNSADGYAASSGWVTSLWGVADNPASYSFMQNDRPTTIVTDAEVADKDRLVASINKDEAYTDWYSYFDKKELTVQPGETFTLNLSGFQAMSQNEPAPGAGVAVGTWNGGFSAIEGAVTNDSGDVTLSFDEPGTYIVSANGSVTDTYDAAALYQLQEVAKDKDGKTVYGKSDWNTGDSWVGYTEEDHGEGPYPWDEIQWMALYDEDGEPVYNAETFDAGHLLYTGMVTRACSTIAPVCVVNVVEPATALDYSGEDVWFVKEDLASPFGMLRPQADDPEPKYTITADGTKVKIKFRPKNTTVYAGFYLGADVRLPGTWNEDNFIPMTGNIYEFELDASYCGKAWPIAAVKKADMTATTDAQYYLAIPSADKLPHAAASADVTMTVNNKGVLAQAKDGSAMLEKTVTVADIDEDGHLTFDEALVAAHDAYFEGGAEAGYATGDPYGSGLSVTKLWGTETTNTLFYTNGDGLATGVMDDEVAAGDVLYASVNADDVNYADWQTKFDKTGVVYAEAGEEISLTLSGRFGMAYTDEEKTWVPLKGVQVGIWKDGAFEAIDSAVTDADGKATFKIDEKGDYIITAQGTVPGTSLTGEAIDCPTMAPYCKVSVVEPASELAYSGEETHFVKADLQSEFGMYRVQSSPKPIFVLSKDGSKVRIKFKPKNNRVYPGFYLGGDIRLPGTWDEDNYISLNSDGIYDFELDASYCGKAWPAAVVKEDKTTTTSEQYYLAIPSADKLPQLSDPVDITVTIDNKGAFAEAKDGSAMVEKTVTVADIDEDGYKTIDEALVAAHDAYFDGGAAAGYSQGEAFTSKLWGVSTQSILYFVNDTGLSNGATVDTVAEGDALYAALLKDDATYGDWYSKFDKKEISAKEGTDISVNLTGHLGMGYDEETTAFVPIKNAQIGYWKDGAFVPIEGAVTDEDGNATFQLEAGDYILTAQGTVPGTVTNYNLIAMGADNTPPYGTMDLDAFEMNVAYTDEDYGDGPYPAEEVKYIDFFEPADDDSDNDYAWQDLHFLKSNQLIAQNPVMPAAIQAEVTKVSKLDQMKEDVIAEIEGSVDLSEYSPAGQAAILKEIVKAQAAIIAAGSTDEVAGIVENFKELVAKNSPAGIKSLWASKHEVGQVVFKWTGTTGTDPANWQVKYRTKKIEGGSWGGWKTETMSGSTYQYTCKVPANYVVEIHAKSSADKEWSKGIITTPAGGKYQAMKTVYVKNAKTNKRVDSITMKVGDTIQLKPDYEYPIADYTKRPRLYPTQALWDVDAQGKSMLTVKKPDGSVYSGGMINGNATVTANKAGTTTLICRAPNGRTKAIKITVKE